MFRPIFYNYPLLCADVCEPTTNEIKITHNYFCVVDAIGYVNLAAKRSLFVRTAEAMKSRSCFSNLLHPSRCQLVIIHLESPLSINRSNTTAHVAGRAGIRLFTPFPNVDGESIPSTSVTITRSISPHRRNIFVKSE